MSASGLSRLIRSVLASTASKLLIPELVPSTTARDSVAALPRKLNFAISNFIPWAPIASGSAKKLVSDGLEAVAKQHGVSVFQVALAWLLAKSPVMLPIPGTSSVAHLEDNVGAAGLELSAQDLARLG